ncbi:MAG: AAA family ATPase [Proteobacteria bacterium]|nr:AAA family ATPase [Pseudomonadota bacterium]
MNEIEKYLNLKEWNFKFNKGGEYCLDLCPLCEAGPGHFYINQAKEIFYCHKCGERGHLLSLKKRLGDLPAIAHISEFSKRTPGKTIDLSVIEKYHKTLLENSAALNYLTQERAFTLDTIKKFKLGENNGAIAIPHMQDGKCRAIKYRRINPNGGNKYHREEGCDSILFNLDSVGDKGWIVLTGGEFDAIAYYQMGIHNAVAVTVGEDTFLDEWVDPLEPFGEIFVSFDMDEAGRKGADKVGNKLGRYRCFNVLLPLKDANDCLKAGYSNAEIKDIMAQAKRFEFKLIKTPENYFDQIRELHSGKSQNKGIRTEWNNFDSLMGGIRPNELTVLTGETASGKTTMAANLGFKLAGMNHPVLIASFEMKPIPILRKMVQMETGSHFSALPKDELEKALRRISSLPIYFIDVYGEIGLEQLKGAIYYAKRRYGIEFVILDHLHFFLKYSGDHERQAIDQALTAIKSWAMDLGIHVLLIVHPTKLTYDNKVVHLNDLKGSSGLKQIPDNVLSIWRPRGEDNSKSPTNEIVLYILKVRDDSGDEGKVILTFDKRSQSYSEPSGSGPREVSPAEEKVGLEPSSSRSRIPSRDWQSTYDR